MTNTSTPTKSSGNADQLIDSLLRTGAEFKDPPEIVVPAAEGGPPANPEPPQVIAANDAEGRQAGDPDAPIDLPKEIVSEGPKMFKMLAGDEAITEDLILDKRNPVSNPTMPPMPLLSEVLAKPAEPVTTNTPAISEQTRIEMEAGRARLAAVAELLPPQEAPVPASNIGMAFAPRHEQAATAPAPMISAQTRAEMEAGRLALQRRRDDAAYGQHVTNEAAAKRQAENAAPSADDLSYSAPRQR